jgi:hypothetical protein
MKPTATNEVVCPPADPQTTIRRYMDFPKFIATLEHSGLFFSRCAQFDDLFEGSFPRSNDLIRQESLARLGFTPEQVLEQSSRTSEVYKWVRHWVVANCWNMDRYESAALWQRYGKTKEAVCIVSSYQRLRDCLPADIWIGEVTYKDYDEETFEEGNVFIPFVHKRRSYTDERELRALDWETPSAPEGRVYIGDIPPDSGWWVACDLCRLVDHILVAPTSPDWVFELVKDVTRRHAMTVEVKRSSLDDKPSFWPLEAFS